MSDKTEIRKHALTFLNERLLKILVSSENIFPPALEKLAKEYSVRMKRQGRRLLAHGEEADFAIKPATAFPELMVTQ